mmetsp:Transcript_17167/g.26805  ORF Transcript_17167/g.26805 Transcript_17167/m.26805 type:complete len:203 (-) Transcript_17167:333-941(-)
MNLERCEHLFNFLFLLVHHGVKELVNRIQTELAERTLQSLTRFGLICRFHPAFSLGIEKSITPQSLKHFLLGNAKFSCIHLCELWKSKSPAHETTAESNGSLFWVDLKISHDRVVVGSDDNVDVLKCLEESLVGLLRVQLKLQKCTIDFVYHYNWPDSLSKGLSKDSLRLYTDTFNTVHNNKRTVCHSECSSHFRTEINVSW